MIWSEIGTKSAIVCTAAILGLIAVVSAEPVTQPSSAPAVAYEVEETRLGTKEAGLGKPTFSPDGHHLAFIANAELKPETVFAPPQGPSLGEQRTPPNPVCVVVDGQHGLPYDGIGDLVWSVDGEHVAYVARKGKKSMVVMDGKEGTEYDGIGLGSLFLRGIGNRLAYVAQSGAKQLVVSNGKEGPEYDGVGDLSLTMDGKHIAYRARRGNKWLAVLDGQEGVEYDFTYSLLLSSDGTRVAYYAKKDTKRLVVVDGQEGTGYDGIDCLVLSPDGKHIAYRAQKGNKQLVVVDGQDGPDYDDIGKDSIVICRDHIGYVARRGQKWQVVVDGKVGREYDGIARSSLVFSSDGENVAYVAIDGGSSLIVLNGQEYTKFDGYGGGLAFRPDGKRVTYVGLGTRTVTVKSDPMAGHFTGGVMNQKHWVMVDGQRSPEYDAIGKVAFSADGEHVAYAAKYLMKTLVLLDGKKVAEYDGAVTEPTFFADGILEYLAEDMGSFYWVRHVPVGHNVALRRTKIDAIATTRARPAAKKQVTYNGVARESQNVVYIVDHSGSTLDWLDFARIGVIRSIHALDDDQGFNVVMVSNRATSLEPKGQMMQAKRTNKKTVTDELEHFQAKGENDDELAPFKDAFEIAFKAQPDLIIFVNDGRFDPKLLDVVATLNKGNSVRINTFAFLRVDADSEKQLKELAEKNGGVYKLVSVR